MLISGLHRRSTGELEVEREPQNSEDRNDILDPDDLAAELMGEAEEPPTTTMSRPRSDQRALARPPAARLPPSAAALAARLEQAEAELTRLRRHMRARDAYLAELEHALHASTSKLEASGIGSIEDAHKLFGRVRGQAFRIAELESELRGMEQRLSRLPNP